jgi:class 3 adenylate cyclase
MTSNVPSEPDLRFAASVQSLKATGNILLRCRIGISTGTVIIGNLGHETPDGSIAGEALDIAARLQMSAQPSSVIIDGATRRLVGTLFDCRWRKTHSSMASASGMHFGDNVMGDQANDPFAISC